MIFNTNMSRYLTEYEIEYILDFLKPIKSIPIKTALSIIKIIKDKYISQLRKQKVYPQIIEELKKNIIATKLEVVECFVEELTKEIFRITSDHGYHIAHINDIGFILMALKAIMLRYENIYHPIQDFIDQSSTTEDDDSIDTDLDTIDE